MYLVSKTVTHHDTLHTFHNHGSKVRIDVHDIRENEDWQTITKEMETYDTVGNIKSKIQVREGTASDQQLLVFNGRLLEDEWIISDYNIFHGSTLHTSGNLNGGAAMSAEVNTNALGVVNAQLQQVQTALAAEQETAAYQEESSEPSREAR